MSWVAAVAPIFLASPTPLPSSYTTFILSRYFSKTAGVLSIECPSTTIISLLCGGQLTTDRKQASRVSSLFFERIITEIIDDHPNSYYLSSHQRSRKQTLLIPSDNTLCLSVGIKSPYVQEWAIQLEPINWFNSTEPCNKLAWLISRKPKRDILLDSSSNAGGKSIETCPNQ